jgi:hypothetical protein
LCDAAAIPSPPARAVLPGRRHLESRRVPFGGQNLIVTFHRMLDGRVAEIFCNVKKPGSAFNAAVQDGCILISIMLQAGFPVAYLRERMGRESGDAPASILGALLDAAAEAEAGK